MRRDSNLSTFRASKFYTLDSAIAKVLGERGNHSGGFWFAGDLALDLLSEFQGPGNLRKNFGRPAGAPHDDSSVAQDPSERRFFDRDAFDSWQKKLDGSAIDDPRLYDDSFVGDGHLRGAAPHETNSEKNRGYQQTGNAHPSQRAGKGSSSGVYGACRDKERGRTHQCEDGGDQSMAHHDDPMQSGFILHGFARNEMFFRVAQRSPLKEYQRLVWRYGDGPSAVLILLWHSNQFQRVSIQNKST
jgi:hypothetical protein